MEKGGWESARNGQDTLYIGGAGADYLELAHKRWNFCQIFSQKSKIFPQKKSYLCGTNPIIIPNNIIHNKRDVVKRPFYLSRNYPVIIPF